jgi:hemerythrin-like domain-containing protein
LEFNNETKLLNDVDLKYLDEALDVIKNKAYYHSSKFSKHEYDVIKKMVKFPSDKAFPSLDIYRMFLMHPGATENYKVFEYATEYLSALINHLTNENTTQPT